MLVQVVPGPVAGAGVLGLAIGFTFQEIAANFFSGTKTCSPNQFRTSPERLTEESI